MQPSTASRSAPRFLGPLARLALALAPLPALAQTPQVPGFCVRKIPVGHEITGIAQGPGGAWGEHVYLTGNGVVKRVTLGTGLVEPFASGLATGSGRPAGAAFDTGVFGTGHLYVAQNSQLVGVQEVLPDGTHSTFSASGSLFSCNDIAFPRPGSAFGSFAFVTNGGFVQLPSISKVDAAGTNSTFHPGAGLKTIIGLAFPPPGSGFGANLFVGEFTDELVYEVAPDGTTTPFPAAGPMLGQAVEDLAFSPPAGPFGDFMYVTTADTRKVVRVDPQGNATDFLTGLAAMNGWNGDLAFSNDGDQLFVADGLNLLVVTFGPYLSDYCTGKTNSCGTQPSIGATGVPSAAATSGFVISASNAKAGKFGLLIYTDRGPADLPFQGGTLCLFNQGLRRSVAISDTTGTPPACDGTLSIDMNAFARGLLGGNPAAFLSAPGTQVNCQFWGRDTVAAGSLLSDALVYGVCL